MRQFFGAICAFAALTLAPIEASAHQFLLGIGGGYGQTSVPSQSGSGSAIYRGPTLAFEPRLRFVSGMFSDSAFGLDLFGNIGQFFGQNIAGGVDEANSTLSYGGGIDFRISSFFIGMQYMSVRSEIGPDPSRTEISYPSFGGRVGVNLLSTQAKSSYSVILVGIAESGSASIGGSTRSVLRYSGSLMLSWDLFSLFNSRY